MFGYVKPAYAELKVRENELYRAYYCGMCRSLGKCTGCLSRFTLNHDFVFLAMLRRCALGEKTDVKMRRCPVHPVKKRPSAEQSPSLEYAACASAALTRAKIDDTRADERGARRLAAGIVTPAANHALRRAEKLAPGLYENVTAELKALYELEAEKNASVDESADAFGRVLGHVASSGIDGPNGRVLYEIGRLTGRFIYVTDAADDAYRDSVSGNYNPIVLAYGGDVCEKREVYDLRGRAGEKFVLRREIAEEILCAGVHLTGALCSAVALLDFSAAPELEGIIDNICRIGMPGELRRVLGLTVKPESAGG